MPIRLAQKSHVPAHSTQTSQGNRYTACSQVCLCFYRDPVFRNLVCSRCLALEDSAVGLSVLPKALPAVRSILAHLHGNNRLTHEAPST